LTDPVKYDILIPSRGAVAQKGDQGMYYKNLTGKAVVKAETKPAGMWREATEREYNEYRAYIARLMGDLEKAVAYKRAMLRA